MLWGTNLGLGDLASPHRSDRRQVALTASLPPGAPRPMGAAPTTPDPGEEAGRKHSRSGERVAVPPAGHPGPGESAASISRES